MNTPDRVVLQPSPHEYGSETDPILHSHQVVIDGNVIGDLVEFYKPLGYNHRVVLTCDCAPYSNGSFATHEGALNYMKLVADAVDALAEADNHRFARYMRDGGDPAKA